MQQSPAHRRQSHYNFQANLARVAGPACSERPPPIQPQGRPTEFTTKRLESKMLLVFSRRRKVSYLIQDHERALWTAEPRKAMREIGVQLLESYPKCGQDLKPIAAVWCEIRARLNDTEPQKMEARKVFLQRLRNAVAWGQHQPQQLAEGAL